MIFIAGRCDRCTRQYELPRQEREASAYLQAVDGRVILTILCVNALLCRERAEQIAKANRARALRPGRIQGEAL